MALLLVACSSTLQPLQPDATGDPWSVPFPTEDTRQASLTSSLPGADYKYALEEGTSIESTTLRLASSTSAFKWAHYVFALPPGATNLDLTVNVSELTGPFYVGVADYASDSWNWQGPFDASTLLDLSVGNYTSGVGNLHWVIAAGPEVGLVIVNSQIEFEFAALEVPPAGGATIVPLGAAPSLVYLPEGVLTAAEGAPAVVYAGSSGSGSSLSLAFYRGGNWESWPIEPDRVLSSPNLLWLDGGAMLIVHDTAANTLVALRFDVYWRVIAETTLFTPPVGQVVASLSADYDSVSGELGVLHSTTITDTAGAAWYTNIDTNVGTDLASEQVYSGETVAGLSMAFSPDGVPWAGYSHGTWDTTAGFTLDFTLDLGSRASGSWVFAPLSYPDDPLYIDISFDATGQAQAVFTTNRMGSIVVPGFVDEELPVMFDVVVAHHNGTNWDVERVFESTFDFSLNPWTQVITLQLNLAPLAVWTRTDQILYNRYAGTVEIKITNLSPLEYEVQSGTLSNHPAYLTGGFGAFGLDTTYFTGAAGSNFNWAEHGDIHGSAYVANSELDLLELLAGEIEAEGALLYWRK